ncbi:gliding motility-associated lipoprotein GldB [Chitinophaga eiseniae]|uniref:Gliding motility-associated lipoprotein GldB n=1 Tax=Chitinophaga eiseniae TaxID=634771 RepID=A0A1T4QYJ4_9BACT|nr:hypothetical protein [Chitinophaga eiseniae]SKA08783.1 gliding motility-associated lipoprotein GldB [Chitinophaga eiseniae]
MRNNTTYSLLTGCLAALFLYACHTGNKAPDVSHIPMNVSIQRFDSALFTIDTNDIQPGMTRLHQSYPLFMPIYISEIMNFGAFTDSSKEVQRQLRLFLTNRDFRQLETAVSQKYANAGTLQKELEEAFRYTQYYIPAFRAPKVVTFTSGIANYGAITIDSILGIGLDMYMGADFPPYAQIPDYPDYMIRRFAPEYITTNCMQVLQQQLYPAPRNSGGLLEQMIEAGKQQYFLSKVLPHTPDSIRLGYTKEQLQWCRENEKMIWQFFVQNNLLYTTDWQQINLFMNDAPATQGMPEGSPGKIGYFVGYEIVNKYMEKHADVSVQQLMESKNLLEIFKASKYRP